MTRRLQIAKVDVLARFDQVGDKLYQKKELASILEEQRRAWRLTARTNADDFIAFLRKQRDRFRVYDFPFPSETVRRYGWGSTSLLQAALCLKPRSYLSHYTAVRAHGLTEQVPKTIYVTYEAAARLQPKPAPTLSQSAIAAAFSKPQRHSSAIADVGDVRVQLISGKPSGQVGVEEGRVADDNTGDGLPVRITGVERTLIDITVHPDYAGGVPEVLKAFRNAKEQVSANRLQALLKKLDHAYPFHQAIGFYLVRAGYSGTAIDLFRKIPQVFDFYLAHDLGETDFDPEWRLHVPKSL